MWHPPQLELTYREMRTMVDVTWVTMAHLESLQLQFQALNMLWREANNPLVEEALRGDDMDNEPAMIEGESYDDGAIVLEAIFDHGHMDGESGMANRVQDVGVRSREISWQVKRVLKRLQLADSDHKLLQNGSLRDPLACLPTISSLRSDGNNANIS
ncbi:hypothetical protein PIB30_048888 [Stylosanthes scabra]|uniref:Uncharacterized protein n=1 Tax=Stylosanthes scabra TaxID=79078 RepID=A0ABU6RHW5_9FABA|nr:hypothetical protein [Stylosanthes scabra]